jgi:hypothetical protein
MKYRKTTSVAEQRGQVMTPTPLALAVMQTMSGDKLEWLELGVGSGRIANACVTLRKPSRYVGVELDRELTRACSPGDVLDIRHVDVLNPKALQASLGQTMFSRVTGNPPYGVAALSKSAQARLAALCPGLPTLSGWGQVDLYFVLESLSRLSRPGEAAFIVGAALAEDAKLAVFRGHMLESASEVECYELPSDAFDGDIEVQSYLLVARFGNSGPCQVTVGRMRSGDFAVTERRKISTSAATVRLDLSYHQFCDVDATLRRKRGTSTLRELGGSIVRGSRSKHEFKDLAMRHFHTSDFPSNGIEIRFDHLPVQGFQLAQRNDVLLPRVGSRCLDRQAIVVDGCLPFTEAVLRLRLPENNRQRVVEWITSDPGTAWRRGVAKGSCAKHVTVSSLLDMPIPA